MKKQLEQLDHWLRTGNWFGQPRAAIIIPAMLLTIVIMLLIIRRL